MIGISFHSGGFGQAPVYGRTLSVVRDEMPFIAADDMPWVLGKTALTLWPFGSRA